MNFEFPSAVPEIPVKSIAKAAEYYRNNLGIGLDWGGDEGGIAGVGRGACRMFLTNEQFRTARSNLGPIVIWLNLNSKDEVDALHREWSASNAKLLSAPESKPWGLHEFTAADLDGNLFRVFYDFATPEREKNA
jgi:predicted lactoylglutathione lyase